MENPEYLKTPDMRLGIWYGAGSRTTHFIKLDGWAGRVCLGWNRFHDNQPGVWMLRIKNRKYGSKYTMQTIGFADDEMPYGEDPIPPNSVGYGTDPMSYEEAIKRVPYWLDLLMLKEIDETGKPERVSVCQLYRCFDEQDVLLYVGISLFAMQRLAAHRTASWYTDVRKILIENHPSRVQAMLAEAEAVRLERPKFNSMFAQKSDFTSPS